MDSQATPSVRTLPLQGSRSEPLTNEQLAMMSTNLHAKSKDVVYTQGSGGKSSKIRKIAYRAGATLVATGALIFATNAIGPAQTVAEASLHQSDARAIVTPEAETQKAPRALPAKNRVAQAVKSFQVPSFNVDTFQPTEAYFEYLKIKEGRKLRAYLDDGNVWTIGFGHTGLMPDGQPIGKGMTITDDEALALLRLDVAVHAQGVRDMLGSTPVSQSQFEALVDFAFNKGLKRLEGSTLFSKLMSGDYLGSADEFTKWIYVTKKDDQGRALRGPDGRPIMEILPGLETRAKNNYDMMRAGFTPKAIALLESNQAKELIESRSLRASASRIAPLSFTNDASQNMRTMTLTAHRLGPHIENLDKKLSRQAAFVENIKAERHILVEQLKKHPGSVNPHVNAAQANEVMDLVGKIGVLERIQQTQEAQRHLAADQKRYFEDYKELMEETAGALRNGLDLLSASVKSNAEALDESQLQQTRTTMGVALETWSDAAQTPAPANSLPMLNEAAMKRLHGQFTSLNTKLDAQMDRALRHQPQSDRVAQR